MDKIQFLNSSNIYDVKLSKDRNTVKLFFTEESMPNNLNKGFKLINEHNGNIMGDYSAYTTVYKEYPEEAYTVELSNDGSVYTESDKTVKFTVMEGGKLEGDLTQAVKDYSEIVVPTPLPNADYQFIEWEPEIPSSGKVENDKTFKAIFNFTETRKKIADLEAEISNLQSQIEAKKFELTSTDYIIIKISELEYIGETQEEYDISAIHESRQAIRDEINALEDKIEDIDAEIVGLRK